MDIDVSLVKLEVIDNYEVRLHFSDEKIKICDALEFIGRVPRLEQFNNKQLFKDRCCIINETMAFDIVGNRDEYNCYDVALEYLYLEFPSVQAYELYKQIKEFKPIDGEWVDLDDILSEVYESGYEYECLGAMYRLYEKYPEEDNEVLWGMMHGIEGIKGYEERIQWSLKRQPSFFVIMMINRLLNDRVMDRSGEDLILILKSLKRNTDISEMLRKTSEEFYKYQISK